VLDLFPEDRWMTEGQIKPALLADILRGLAAASGPPLLIVDLTGVQGPSETVRQLVLRNSFCSELFDHGVVAGILALSPCMGIWEQQYSWLVDGMAKGLPLGQIVEGLRHLFGQKDVRRPTSADPTLANRLLEDLIGLHGTALFSGNPSAPVVQRPGSTPL
jgi:hypothetical protein